MKASVSCSDSAPIPQPDLTRVVLPAQALLAGTLRWPNPGFPDGDSELKAFRTVKFNGKTVTVTDQNNSATTTATIPSIVRVDYDTTLDYNMIVFTWRGTEQYNERIHGGEIMLKCVLVSGDTSM